MSIRGKLGSGWCPTRHPAGLILAIAVIAYAVSPPPARAAVFGSDDRTKVPERHEAVADRIGLLFNNKARTVCSAFCVADNVIATAAHCLVRGQGTGTSRYTDFMFARNFDRVKEYSRIEGAQSGSAAQSIIAGDFKLRVRPPIDAVNDWALVRLHRRICPGGLPVEVMPISDIINEAKAGRVFQVSYHRDWAQWKAAYSKPCGVSRDFDAAKWQSISPDFINPDQMILHTCDTGGASSGSPILLEAAGGGLPVVVGINVGTYVQSKVVTQNGQVTGRQGSETVANTAVNARMFAHQLERLRSATILPSGSPLRDLQERLKEHGHYTGAIDGLYGSGMKAAIEAYEAAHQLPVVGLPTQAVLTHVGRSGARGGTVTPSSSIEQRR